MRCNWCAFKHRKPLMAGCEKVSYDAWAGTLIVVSTDPSNASTAMLDAVSASAAFLANATASSRSLVEPMLFPSEFSTIQSWPRSLTVRLACSGVPRFWSVAFPRFVAISLLALLNSRKASGTVESKPTPANMAPAALHCEAEKRFARSRAIPAPNSPRVPPMRANSGIVRVTVFMINNRLSRRS